MSSRRALLRTLSLAWISWASGCVIDASIDGKRCPCAEGYACDEDLDLCVLTTCEPSFRVTDFDAVWATPNGIYYRFTPTGDEADFLSYTLVIAETKDDLRTRSGTARVLDAGSNPELAHYRRPQTGGELMDSTLARNLDPDTVYVARLEATDARQCAFSSPVVATRTPSDASASIWLFEDQIAGSSFPLMGLSLMDGELVYTLADDPTCSPAPDADPICGPPIGLRNLSLNVIDGGAEEPKLQASNFESAFLEVRVANEGEIDSHISEMWLWLAGCAGDANLFEFRNFTLPASDLGAPVRTYQTIQAPLRFLENGSGQPLTLAAFATPICAAAIGAQWNKTGRVFVDGIRIRY